jgi:hypothetical protein
MAVEPTAADGQDASLSGVQPPAGWDPWNDCLKITVSISNKADKYKAWSRWSVLGITSFSAAIPVLIGLGGNWATQKLIPSVLAAVSAVLAAWIQLERPHERWKLYRRYHRMLEAEQLNYRALSGPYEGVQDPKRLLAIRLGNIQMNLHDEWEGLIPTSAQVAATARQRQTDG